VWWFANPGARSWTCEVPAPVRAGDVRSFHQGLPGYRPTPLVEAPALASALAVGRVFVKDESDRLGLPAFKILGASWAVSQLLRAGRPPGLVLVTATDGNHGRAVARVARLVEAGCRVFVPAVAGPDVIAAIAAEGAVVTQVAGSYDEAVAAAAGWAQDQPAAELVQDTAWPGYEQVPAWIAEGYSTLFAEADEQLAAAGAGRPTLVAVPVGVGSLAQAAVTHYRGREPGTTGGTALLSVEPDTAACLLASLEAGTPVPVPTAATIMAGLNCGTVSAIAWPYLAGGLDAAIAVSDGAARGAMADLAAAGISAGPSGASSLAGAGAALTGPGSAQRRGALSAGSDSVMLLLSTEGLLPGHSRYIVS
jgi:diaminopropionate ammonia-lyase